MNLEQEFGTADSQDKIDTGLKETCEGATSLGWKPLLSSLAKMPMKQFVNKNDDSINCLSNRGGVGFERV